MKDVQSIYQRKLTTPQQAVARIPRTCNLSFGLGPSNPPSLLAGLADRVDAGDVDEIHLYYQIAKEAAKPLFKTKYLDRLRFHSNFMTDLDRGFIREAGTPSVIDFMPCYLWQLPRILSDFNQMDAFLITVSPMDKHGYFSLGTSCDFASTVARNCGTLLVEVNENMPRVFGENLIHVSDVDSIVENHAPLLELEERPLTQKDILIGSKITEMVPNGACLQFGIGGIPNAVAKSLTNHTDLGIHTEMLTSSVVDLHEAGAITNKKKTIHPLKTVFSLCWGTKKLYDFIDDNPSVESYPSTHINDPAVIQQNDNVVSVNSIIEIDLLGQVNSEYISGHEFSGVGGQRDFMSGAFRSRGGMSFLAFYSTTKDDQVSKIVPHLTGPITESRMEPMCVVTEHGITNLKGKTNSQRALALIEIAAPQFREELLRQAKEMGLIR
ncbi:MAG: acetyl-CoA hydrolase/transferase C-terminal domain-containing protein [Pseudomonadota bacterium]